MEITFTKDGSGKKVKSEAIDSQASQHLGHEARLRTKDSAQDFANGSGEEKGTAAIDRYAPT